MKDLPERECEECGSTENVSLRYGRETCEVSDPWFACWACFSLYWEIRVHGDTSSASDSEGNPVENPTPTTGQTGLVDFL